MNELNIQNMFANTLQGRYFTPKMIKESEVTHYQISVLLVQRRESSRFYTTNL